MIVYDRPSDIGQDSSNVPLVTVVEPVGSRVSAKKEYLFFGDMYIPLKIRITNTTQYNAWTMTINWQELGGVPRSKGVAFSLAPGQTTTLDNDLTLSKGGAVSVSAWIVAMYTPTQPVSEPAKVVDLQLSVS